MKEFMLMVLDSVKALLVVAVLCPIILFIMIGSAWLMGMR